MNRCLVSIHDRSAQLLYKTKNIYAAEERDIFFLDPLHLMKTTRNCWASDSRNLWVRNKKIVYYYPNDCNNRIMVKKYHGSTCTSFT